MPNRRHKIQKYPTACGARRGGGRGDQRVDPRRNPTPKTGQSDYNTLTKCFSNRSLSICRFCQNTLKRDLSSNDNEEKRGLL